MAINLVIILPTPPEGELMHVRRGVAALSVASACGHEVVVESSQTEVSRVLAKPTGELLFESAVVPQWTRRVDGAAEIRTAPGAGMRLAGPRQKASSVEPTSPPDSSISGPGSATS